ncbi:MAG TPA: type II toxin-antitoxin system Phd/YefM family antitoxin [Anaerolineae bacterium]|jgi:prevent-host-death family protein
MDNIWQLQDAKNKLSEVIEAALSDGPQVITKRGVETAVVVSYIEYRKLMLKKQKLSEFFGRSPLVGSGIDLTREDSPLPDDIEL